MTETERVDTVHLERLAVACGEDGRYATLVSAPPLTFTGTADTPPGPVAIR
jgi:hypothetical protein